MNISVTSPPPYHVKTEESNPYHPSAAQACGLLSHDGAQRLDGFQARVGGRAIAPLVAVDTMPRSS